MCFGLIPFPIWLGAFGGGTFIIWPSAGARPIKYSKMLGKPKYDGKSSS